MWQFKAAQKVFQIGSIRVGGHPNERPTVLIGSIFYRGHRIVSDPRTGEFDEEKAEALIKKQQEYSDKTGLPHIVDVVGENPDVMVKYLDFVTSRTNAVIGLDGTVPSVRMRALDYIKDAGLKNPFIYNSLMEPREDEIQKIKDNGIVKSAILLTYNMKDFTTKGRISQAKVLIDAADRAGIENILIDTCVLDIPTLGMACRALYELKSEFGYPVGCGAHNAVGMWRGVEKKMGRQVIKPGNAVASAMTVAWGADFVLYGPIDDADIIFPVIAMMNASYGQLFLEEGGRLDRSHPRYRIA